MYYFVFTLKFTSKFGEITPELNDLRAGRPHTPSMRKTLRNVVKTFNKQKNPIMEKITSKTKGIFIFKTF